MGNSVENILSRLENEQDLVNNLEGLLITITENPEINKNCIGALNSIYLILNQHNKNLHDIISEFYKIKIA